MIDALTTRFPNAGLEPVDAPDGMPTVYVPLVALADVAQALRDAPEFGFSVLIDMIPVDLHPHAARFEITYLLLNPGRPGADPSRLRLKVRVPRSESKAPTLSHVWASANWAEREAYDFFGITFDGHPDLRRILMPEDWEGYPMRKDYPVQIKQPVKTYEPLQLTEEQFVANIEASKERSRRG